jgi:hypothetical protein
MEEEIAELKQKLDAVKGHHILHELLQYGSMKNEDGMPVITYVDKKNGGFAAYVRHDAMVKTINKYLNL